MAEISSVPALTPASTDGRRAERHRTLLGAKLVYGDGAFTLDCVLRDLSATGARVKVPDGLAVPDTVFLVEMRAGVAYAARVVWKRHPLIGLAFIEQRDLRQADTPLLLFMKRLWTEHGERSGI
jgi:hypothetical protein